MDVHDGFLDVTQDQVAAAHHADVEIQQSEGVQFKRWWADSKSGRSLNRALASGVAAQGEVGASGVGAQCSWTSVASSFTSCHSGSASSIERRVR